MKKEDWNWVALLCMGNLFAVIVKTIIHGITNVELSFGWMLVIYGIFYGGMGIMFHKSKAFEHTKILLPFLIYLIITIVSVVLMAIISVIFDIGTFEELLMYIIIAVLGVLTCKVSRSFYN